MIRVNMWSGPHNIATALMRSWENRPDTTVVDEPFHAAHLARTGTDHPGREEVMATQPTDPAEVSAGLLATRGQIVYAKQMTQHLAPDQDLAWAHACRNALLIRDPREVLASCGRSDESCEPDDLGIWQQVSLRDSFPDAPVIDAGDFLRNPEAHLRWLCDWLEVEFSAAMLRWPAGPRPSDGAWGRYRYAAVNASTGFEAWRPRQERLDERREAVAGACLPAFERLYGERVRV